MRKIKEVLRLKLGYGLPVRSVAQSLGIAHSTVIDTDRHCLYELVESSGLLRERLETGRLPERCR